MLCSADWELSEFSFRLSDEMSLHLHRARRADRLVTALAEVLADPLPDPFATEIVVVPTRGVERWLAQSLSRRLGRTPPAGVDQTEAHRDGVCAGVAFWSPSRLTGEVTSSVTGVERRDDPWLAPRSVWPLLEIITEARHEPWAAPIWRSSRQASMTEAVTGGQADSSGRRYGLARHLAELVQRYGTARPALLSRWQRGDDSDADGRGLPPEFAWQAEAYRRLRARIGVPGPAERLAAVCEAVTAAPERSPLPQRLSIFGITRLPPDQLAVIEALARGREVHVWLPHPSPALWCSVAAAISASGDQPETELATALPSRASDPTAQLPRHRLLAYLGRDVRELQVLLHQQPIADDTDHDQIEGRDQLEDDHGGDDHGRLDLLHRLQRDIAQDRSLTDQPGTGRLLLGDHSVSVHASHGPDRQVEVLRELLLTRLQDDPSLEPRDIIVMCPDIETFAPLISASFGVETEQVDRLHPGHRLRVRLADRSLRQLNPLLSVLGQVFDLAESRLEASTLLDLCTSAPVAAKFGLSEDDQLRLRDLIGRAGVRWGLDGQDRARFAMGAFGQNTWAAGLDRLLLGVAMDEEGEHHLGTALPMDDVDSGDVEALGQLSEAVARIADVLDQLSGARSPAAWIELCRDVLDALTAVPPSESWQASQAYAELARIGAVTAHSKSSNPSPISDPTEPGRGQAGGLLLSRAEMRLLLAESFGGRPSRANFRTGTLTMCTMLPMRSVPHRIVCLLGLDDGVFPRTGQPDGDDVLATDPWIGDRDPRSEDRQLMLDAIMAATDEVVVIYSGADPRTNAIRPPSVPVGELLDVLDLTARSADGGPARGQILHRHPLQPFDPRNFGGGGSERPFSFDRAALAGARQLRRLPERGPDRARGGGGGVAAARAELAGLTGLAELPEYQLPDLIELADLIRFFQHPARAYLRNRTGLSRWGEDPEPSDEIPVELDGLQAWSIGDRMLGRHLQGIDLDQLAAAEWRRGTLPPRQLGARTLDPVARSVTELGLLAGPYLEGVRRQLDVRIDLPAGADGSFRGRSLVGTVTSIVDDRLVSVSYSRLNAKHRLRSWIELLALSAAEPGTAWTAITIGRGGQSRLGPVPPPTAALLLADLADLYRTGLNAPIPLPIQVAAAYAAVRYQDRSVDVARGRLEKTWERERDSTFELFYGAGTSMADLQRESSIRAEERGNTAEPSRFATLARRVWQPLIDSEMLS